MSLVSTSAAVIPIRDSVAFVGRFSISVPC